MFFFHLNLFFIKGLDVDKEKDAYGSALGPDWSFNISMKGSNEVI